MTDPELYAIPCLRGIGGRFGIAQAKFHLIDCRCHCRLLRVRSPPRPLSAYFQFLPRGSTVIASLEMKLMARDARIRVLLMLTSM